MLSDFSETILDLHYTSTTTVVTSSFHTRVASFFLEMSLYPSIFFVPFPLSLCMERTSYVLSFLMVFFYLVATGWILYFSLCENQIVHILLSVE